MKQNRYESIKPFVSVVFIILTLFTFVFLKMESRRVGYLILKEAQQVKSKTDLQRLKSMKYAQLTSPQRLKDLAVSELTLNEAKLGQVIQISGEKIALRQ